MANSYNTNPLALDTVMPASYKNTAGANFKGRFRIHAIHWNSTRATGTDQLILQDGNGNTIYAEFAQSSGFFPLPYPISYDDLQLTRIDDGTLYLYLLNGNAG
jgi:hypothetical protein